MMIQYIIMMYYWINEKFNKHGKSLQLDCNSKLATVKCYFLIENFCSHIMSLLPSKRVPNHTKLAVYGFARANELMTLTIPEIILTLITRFLYIVDLDYWREHNNERDIMISNDKKQVYLLEMKPRHTINIKGENIIKSNGYDGTNRRIFSWTLSPFQIGFNNMWTIGLEGNTDGFFGINRRGYSSWKSFQTSFQIKSFKLDGKEFHYKDEIKIKMYFEPSTNNDVFDIEFHKNNNLILEYRSIPIGDDYKLSINFIKFSNTFEDDLTLLQSQEHKKRKYAGFEINNFKQKIKDINTRKLWIQKASEYKYFRGIFSKIKTKK